MRIPPNVIFDSVGDDTVVINLNNGAYYALTPEGKRTWDEICEHGHSANSRILQILVSEGLIDDGVKAGSEESVEEKNEAFARYTDLQELLTADPVHDVDERGWPNKI